MQHLLSLARSTLSLYMAKGSHQFLADSDYLAGLSCLAVSCVRSIHTFGTCYALFY